ncbi:CRP-like cAMP-binding protein [Bradyrhizobium ottawaense]
MSKQAEFAVILKMNAMFADLGADELQRLSNLCHTQHLGNGEVLFQKGDAGNALFGVRRGQVRIETGASDGSRLTLNFMGPGDLFGEVAVLDGQNRTADATAGEASELFVLRREDFLSFLEREPKVAIKIIALLCQRIRWQSERMEESMLQPLPVRLARRLCALAADFGSEVHISQGAARRLRRRRPRKRQPPAAGLAQGSDPRSAAWPHPAAEHDQADRDRAERVGISRTQPTNAGLAGADSRIERVRAKVIG